MPANGLRDRQNVREVGGPIFFGRRADCDELEEAVPDTSFGIDGEPEAALVEVAADQVLEPRLVDRHLALLQARHLVRVDIDAQHLIARIGKTGTGDETDVARTEYGNFQA